MFLNVFNKQTHIINEKKNTSTGYMEENSPIDAATHFSPRLENGFGASQGQVGELDEGNAKRIVFLFLRALLFPSLTLRLVAGV